MLGGSVIDGQGQQHRDKTGIVQWKEEASLR